MNIQIPTQCPSCGSTLELVNDQLFCRNSANCSAQSSGILVNFCKKMKLKGFGDKTIEKLGVVTIPELFNLTEKYLVETLGDKIGTKLVSELNRMKTGVELSQLLSALSIPLVGTVAAEKACVKAISLETVELSGKAGENLASWKASTIGKEIQSLPWTYIVKKESKQSEKLDIVVCITGKLTDFKGRTDATTFLESLGFTVKSSVTKDVKYLICEDESKRSSSSYLKALERGIEIVTIKQLHSIATMA